MGFSKRKVAAEEFYGGKELINIWNVNVDNIVISKLAKTKNNSKYLIVYLNELIRPLVLILPKISEHINIYIYIYIIKGKDEDRNKNNKYISLCKDYAKLLEKYKTVWTMLEDF